MTQQQIEEFIVSGYKGIPGTVSLKPDGALLVLAGANGSGKSSFIDGIAECFDPKGVRSTPHPINNTAEEARVEIVTDKARLVRTWDDNDGGKLTVTPLDDSHYKSAKAFVLEATGGELFDPQEFVGLDDKKQRDALLKRVALPFDLDALDADRKAKYDERTAVGRERDAAAGAYKSLTPPTLDEWPKEVSSADIIAEYQAAQSSNAAAESSRQAVAKEEAALAQGQQHLVEMEKNLAAYRASLAAQAAVVEQGRNYLITLPPTIDLEEINARLQSVEQTNKVARAANAQATQFAIAEAALTKKELEYEALTAVLDAIDATKKAGLLEAEFPVEGLSVDDYGITYQGVPFKQVNTAAQIVVAFDLATSAKPDIRLVMVKNGDMLDATSLAGIEGIATERGYIVLMERDRDESREIGAVFSDGAVV